MSRDPSPVDEQAVLRSIRRSKVVAALCAAGLALSGVVALAAAEGSDGSPAPKASGAAPSGR